MSFFISSFLDTHLRRLSTLSTHRRQTHLQASISPMTFNCFLDKPEHSSWTHIEHRSHIIANWPSRTSTSHFLLMLCDASSFVVHSALWFPPVIFGRSLKSTRASSYRHTTISHLFNKFITTNTPKMSQNTFLEIWQFQVASFTKMVLFCMVVSTFILRTLLTVLFSHSLFYVL